MYTLCIYTSSVILNCIQDGLVYFFIILFLQIWLFVLVDSVNIKFALLTTALFVFCQFFACGAVALS